MEPHITGDGSIIRELVHPTVHGSRNQSLAEAEIPAGGATPYHPEPATGSPGTRRPDTHGPVTHIYTCSMIDEYRPC